MFVCASLILCVSACVFVCVHLCVSSWVFVCVLCVSEGAHVSRGLLVELQVQLDQHLSGRHLVQQQAAGRRALALHLLLYGCHGNLRAPQEI